MKARSAAKAAKQLHEKAREELEAFSKQLETVREREAPTNPYAPVTQPRDGEEREGSPP